MTLDNLVSSLEEKLFSSMNFAKVSPCMYGE
jgi:hypothetical protein